MCKIRKYCWTVEIELSYMLCEHYYCFLCRNCDTFLQRIFNLEQFLTTCSEWVKNIHPRNVFQILESLFNKLYSFDINYTIQQKLFKNLAIFDFESVFVQGETFNDTKTITWIGKHIPISVSIFSKDVEEPIFSLHFWSSTPPFIFNGSTRSSAVAN